MEDQVAKAKARKKPVKDAVIQAIEPAAIDEVVKLDDTIDTVQEEPAMTEATENTQNPDMVLFEEFQQAEKKIADWNKRVEEIKAILRKRDANYTDEQVKSVRDKFDAWLKARYPVSVVYRALRTEIDMSAWAPKVDGDSVHIHPTIEAYARQKMAGGVNTPSLRDLYQSAFDYAKDARDEEGAQLLSMFDLDHLKTAFGLVAPAAAKKPGRPAGGGEPSAATKKPRDNSGNKSAPATWPGTNIKFTVSYTASTNNYSVWGRGMGSLIEKLNAAGYPITEQDVKDWVAANHQNLNFS